MKKFRGKFCRDNFSYNSENNKDKLTISLLKKIIKKEIEKLNLK
jgi:hypothetical protein